MSGSSIAAGVEAADFAYFQFPFEFQRYVVGCCTDPGIDIVGGFRRFFVGECEAYAVGRICTAVEFQILFADISDVEQCLDKC